MKKLLKPISPATPKEEFVRQLEDLILAGKLSPGEKLPPERELAVSLQVSRPVVHEGLLDLAAKGLITMRPRHGSWINDFRRSGSLELLNALYRYDRGALEPHLDEGLEEMRRIILEAAADRVLAMAEGDPSAHQGALQALEEEFRIWQGLSGASSEEQAEADFRFYFALVYYSGNPVFPLLLNSAKGVYLGLLTRFFAHPGTYADVTEYKEALVRAIKGGDRLEVRNILDQLSAYASYGQGYGE